MRKFASVILGLTVAASFAVDFSGRPIIQWVDWHILQGGLGQILDSIHLNPVTLLVLLTLLLVLLLSYVSKRHGGKRAPAETMAPPPFPPLRAGGVEERIGRDDALVFLEQTLLVQQEQTVTIVAVQGGGGMGKTFLAHLFAATFAKRTIAGDASPLNFAMLFIGENKSALEAGREFLTKVGYDPSIIGRIYQKGELKERLSNYYARTRGILILDDVVDESVRLLLPETLNWRVLITVRDLQLARSLAPTRVHELQPFIGAEALELFRRILGRRYEPEFEADYVELATRLGNRPYGIRLAAESLNRALVPQSPREFLGELIAGGLPEKTPADDEGTLPSLRPLLANCLERLQKQSPIARELLSSLAVCASDGMVLESFVEWQSGYMTPAQVEMELSRARAHALVLIEQRHIESWQGCTVRLHLDLFQLLRGEDLGDQMRSLHDFLHRSLLDDAIPMEPRRHLHHHLLELIDSAQSPEQIRALYDSFWNHLYITANYPVAQRLCDRMMNSISCYDGKTRAKVTGHQALMLKAIGKLDDAMYLLKEQYKLGKEYNDPESVAKSLGHQALILKAKKKYYLAMRLHKREEAIKREISDLLGLSNCFGNQAALLREFKKFDKALDLLKKVEGMKRDLGARDRFGLANTLGHQAVVFRELGEMHQAMRLHLEQEKICEVGGDRVGLSWCNWNMGLVHRSEGQHKQAVSRFRFALGLEEKIGLPVHSEHELYFREYIDELGHDPTAS